MNSDNAATFSVTHFPKQIYTVSVTARCKGATTNGMAEAKGYPRHLLNSPG
jgi:hypothetical protein